MRIEYELTQEDLTRAYRYLLLASTLVRIGIPVAWLGALAYIGIELFLTNTDPLVGVLRALILATGYTAVALINVFSAGSRARRLLASSPASRGRQWMDFGETGYRAGGPMGSGEAQWSAVLAVIETRSLLLLKLSVDFAIVVPRHAFPPGLLDELHLLLNRIGKPAQPAGFAGRWS